MNLRLVLQTAAGAVLICVASAPSHAMETAAPAISPQVLKAKSDYCKTCHGVDAQGFRGAAPMPRLAGQQPEYIKNQLQAFIARTRTNPVMNNVAHVLSPAMVTALSQYFQNLHPKPLGGGETSPELVAEGKSIFQEGIASQNVPPCASCHGQDATGNGEFPRLAGQLPDYIFGKLTGWDNERHSESSTIMQPIAHELKPEQIRAVAAYVSQLQ